MTLGPTFALVASLLALAACSASPSAANDADAGCTCATTPEGLSTTDLACACARGCASYADAVAELCSRSYYMNVTETTYAGCSLKTIAYDWGASGQTKVYDGATGVLVGFRSDDDTAGQCPGSGTPISSSLAAGTYAPPKSCGQARTRAACPDADAGAAAALDAHG